MSIAARIRAGRGPVWGTLKSAAKGVLTAHLPVNKLTRPLFAALYASHVGARETWIAAKRFWWCEPLFRSQCEAVGKHFRMEQLPYLVGSGRIRIGDGVRLSGKSGVTFSNRLSTSPDLEIGDGTFLGHGCGISVARSVSIGRHCLIAGGVSIRDFDGHPLDAAARRAGEFVASEAVKPVRVGDDVWIGAGSQVLKGVTIGDRSVVAAGSVVAGDVPPDVVVGGRPAKVLKRLAPADNAPPAAPVPPQATPGGATLGSP